MDKRTKRSSQLNSPVEDLSVEAIVVGERRRDDLGDVQELAESIRQYGLLEPIIVDAQNHLVAGERRLQAVLLLGWPRIPAQRFGALTRAERLQLEFEENERRKALTEYERSKRVAELAEWQRVRLADGDTETLPTVGEISTPASDEPPGATRRGPKPRPDSQKAVARELGLTQQEVSERTRHVQAVDRYPELKEFLPKVANEMATRLDALPADARAQKLVGVRTRDKTTLAELSPHLRRQIPRSRMPVDEQQLRHEPPAQADVREAFRTGLQALDPLLRLVPEQAAKALTADDREKLLPVLERAVGWMEKLGMALRAGTKHAVEPTAAPAADSAQQGNPQSHNAEAKDSPPMLVSPGTDKAHSVGEMEGTVGATSPVAGADLKPHIHPCRICEQEMTCQSPSMCGENRYLCICATCVDENERDLAGVS
jgi:ParB-like chromosome segregation protein Spo0J